MRTAAPPGGTRTVTKARCGKCDWNPAGGLTAEQADRAAEKHTRGTGHPTAVVTEPSR